MIQALFEYLPSLGITVPLYIEHAAVELREISVYNTECSTCKGPTMVDSVYPNHAKAYDASALGCLLYDLIHKYHNK